MVDQRSLPESALQAAEDVAKTRLHALEVAGARFNKIAHELCTIAFSDIRDYIKIADGGEIQAIPLDQMVRRKSRAIKKIKEHTQIKESADGSAIFKDSRVEYELYDKLDALKYLCKLRGDEPATQHLVGGNGKPIEHNHSIEAGAAVQDIIGRILRNITGPPTNGDSVSGVGKE
jgi:hypothetical protein